MCLEDVRLGRELSPSAKLVPVATGAAVQLLDPDETRTRITFSSDGTGTVFIGCEGITPAAVTGFALTPGEPMKDFDVERWGKLTTGAWRAFASAGTIQVAVMTASLSKR